MEEHLLPILKYLTAQYPEDIVLSLCMQISTPLVSAKCEQVVILGEQPNTLAGLQPKSLTTGGGCCIFPSFRLSHFDLIALTLCWGKKYWRLYLINPCVFMFQSLNSKSKKSQSALIRSHPSTCMCINLCTLALSPPSLHIHPPLLGCSWL